MMVWYDDGAAVGVGVKDEGGNLSVLTEEEKGLKDRSENESRTG